MGLRTRDLFYLEKASAYLQKPLVEWEQMNNEKFEHEFCELKFVYSKCKQIEIKKQLCDYIYSVEKLRPCSPTCFTFPFREFLRNYGSSRRVGVVVTPLSDDC